MTGAPGFLDFFVLEASEYIEQIDGVLLDASTSGPDADAMQRLARALRGTATMAKLPSFADLAAGIERVGRALQEGSLRWEPALGGALVAAIDDLKTLLRSVRGWSVTDDDRANARTAELSRYAPKRASTTPGESGAGSSTTPPPFLATEAANIAAGLELLTTRSGDAETASNVLNRVRGLRGVAGVKEVAPLAEVLEATEESNHAKVTGAFTLSNGRRGETVLLPGRKFYPQEQTPIAAVDYRLGFLEDVYLVLGDFSRDGSQATVKLQINRMVSWLWIGGLVLTLGAALAILPEARRHA